MKRILLILLFLPGLILSQNLVMNYSFEDTITCIGSPDQTVVEMAPPWFTPTLGSPDFFNDFNSSCWFQTIPSNAFGFQFARTGNCFVGFGAFVVAPYFNNREYVEGKLSDSLRMNHVYCFEMYVSAANDCRYVTDDIGVLFTNDSVYNYTAHLVLPYTPQIINTQGNILNDTLNWMKISGSFMAQGGERFITIGNFNDDQHTTLDTIAGAINPVGYYYIDDVSLVDCTVGISEVSQPSLAVSPNPVMHSIRLNVENYRPAAACITVSSPLGQTVLEKKYSPLQKPRELDVSGLHAGVYLLTFRQGGVSLVRKFVKVDP